MSRTPTRSELTAAINAQGRANSTSTVLFHAAVAERLGLNPSDHKCADLMMSQSEPCTPGRLAELTGLSTGAITGVIDRLERAGFLVREHDSDDRRRVLLRLTQTRSPEVQSLFEPLAKGMEALCENYTIAELAVVLRFMREVHVVFEDLAAQLRRGAPGAASERGTPQLAAAENIARAVRARVEAKVERAVARARAAGEEAGARARAKAERAGARAREEAQRAVARSQAKAEREK